MKRLFITAVTLSLGVLLSQATLAASNEPAGTDKPAMTVQKTGTAWLGVWIENIPVALGNHLLTVLKKDQGLIIQKVSPDSPAQKAGLQTHDIIAKVNDQEIFSKQQLSKLIQSHQPGTTVELAIVRQGKLTAKAVTLEAMPKRHSAPMPPKHYPGMPPMPPQFGTGRHWLPPMHEPFFGPNFDRYFEQQFKHRFKDFDAPMGQQGSWAQFESIQIQSTGKDQHRAEVKFEDSEGNKKHFVFEGNFNEIRQQIMAADDMEEDKKRSLLQALDMNTAHSMPPFDQPPGFMPPNWYNQPFPGPNWRPNNP